MCPARAWSGGSAVRHWEDTAHDVVEWNAPSDSDYYDPYGSDEQDEEPEYCRHCGARWDQACEEWCWANAPAWEPAHGEHGTAREFAHLGSSALLMQPYGARARDARGE